MDIIKEILISEKEFTDTNYRRSKKRWFNNITKLDRSWWYFAFDSQFFEINK